MNENIRYPTWADVGIPQMVVNHIRNLPSGHVLDYLVLNRVFRFNIRAQYIYFCSGCGYSKRIGRHYEDYSSCERCGSSLISSTAYWRMGKDKIQPYSQKETMAAKIIQQMPTNYSQYFRDYPPDDFIRCEWEWDKELEIPHPRGAYGRYNNDDGVEEPFKPHPLFAVQFCCGERVVSATQMHSICKAAILCPFLWDDCFDWKHMVRKDVGRETHILPILSVWSKLNTGNRDGSLSKSRCPRMVSGPHPLFTPDPQYNHIGSDPSGAQGPVGPPGNPSGSELPESVVEALKVEPALLEQVSGGANG